MWRRSVCEVGAVQDEVRERVGSPDLIRLLATSLTLYPGREDRKGPQVAMDCILRTNLFKQNCKQRGDESLLEKF